MFRISTWWQVLGFGSGLDRQVERPAEAAGDLDWRYGWLLPGDTASHPTPAPAPKVE